MDDRERESRAALERLERESETLGSSSLARMGRRLGDHFGGADAVGEGEGGGTDPMELWGRRIGRALSLLGVIALGLWLAAQLGSW
jgi:tetrahydromethanopterin S-methyltransferase subunit G